MHNVWSMSVSPTLRLAQVSFHKELEQQCDKEGKGVPLEPVQPLNYNKSALWQLN